MLDDNFFWLINWFQLHYDTGGIESKGIQIVNLGNPGWNVRICIPTTELDNKEFKDICIERSESDWIFCKVENGFFEGNCGTFNIEEVLKTFRKWIESKNKI